MMAKEVHGVAVEVLDVKLGVSKTLRLVMNLRSWVEPLKGVE